MPGVATVNSYASAPEIFARSRNSSLDKPEGTLWRIDVALDGQVLKSNQVQYGVVPEDKDGVSQSVPDSQDTPPEALQSGEDYYLYVLADIAVPLSRCIFTYSK